MARVHRAEMKRRSSHELSGLASPGPYVDPDQLRRLDPNYADSARYPGNYYAKHADAPFAMDFLVNSFVSPETTLLDRKRFPDFDINKTSLASGGLKNREP
jgi:hypothetical protein